MNHIHNGIDVQRKKRFEAHVRPHHFVVHLRELTPPTAYVAGLDPGWQSPAACILLQVDSKANVNVLSEFQGVETPYRDIVNWLDSSVGKALVTVSCDPAMRAHNQQTGKSDMQFFRDQGFNVTTNPVDVATRLKLIEAYLRGRNHEPKLEISKNCPDLWHALSDYACITPRGRKATCFTPKSSHIIDALSYGLLGVAQLLAECELGNDGLPRTLNVF